MKSIIKIAILFATALMLGGCNEPDGKCSNPPHISTTTLNFNASGGVGAITLDAAWSIGAMFVDNWEFHNMLVCGVESDMDDGICLLISIGSLPYGTEPKRPGERPIHHWESAWFTMTLTDGQLVFDVKPNDTGKERKLLMEMSDCNCFASLAISQSAE